MAEAIHWMHSFLLLRLCLSPGALFVASETGQNYYDALNLAPTATDSQIKKNFRQLVLKYHPDKNKSPDAEKTFRAIIEAYQVLSDKEKRRLYDSMGHEAFLKKDAPDAPEDKPEDGFDFSFADFFHDFDDGSFVREPFFQWSFHDDLQDENVPFQGYSFEEPIFGVYFGDENEEEYLY